MATQLELARSGKISDVVEQVAKIENQSAEFMAVSMD